MNLSLITHLRPGVLGGTQSSANPESNVFSDVTEDVFSAADLEFDPLFIIDEVDL